MSILRETALKTLLKTSLTYYIDNLISMQENETTEVLSKRPCDDPITYKKLHGSYRNEHKQKLSNKFNSYFALISCTHSYTRIYSGSSTLNGNRYINDTDAHIPTKSKAWVSSGCGPSAMLRFPDFKFWLIFYGFKNPSCSYCFTYIRWIQNMLLGNALCSEQQSWTHSGYLRLTLPQRLSSLPL